MLLIFIKLLYLCGKEATSCLWIGKIFYHRDITKEGSGNIGTTNTFRVLGFKAGLVVLFMDILKGTLAASQPYLLHSPVNPLLIGLFASLGHTVSIFDHFHGGKAVATSAGILLAYNPGLFALAASIFHFGTHTVAEAKRFLNGRGIPVRSPFRPRTSRIAI